MSLRNAIQRFKLYHLLFWAALTGVWYFFRYEDYSSGRLAFRITLLKVADLAFMVYVTNYLLIPRLLYRKKYFLFGGCFLAFIFGSSWLKIFVEGQLVHHPELFDLSHHFKSLFYDNTIPHILLVSTGAGFKLIIDYAKAQRRLAEITKEKAEAELNFLRSQINPHFVFNSLNSVYFLIDRKNIPARDALQKFSDMLRYQLYECNGHQTGIEKEIAYLNDYIDLQRLRREDDCQIDFHYSPQLTGFSISPLLLIPFVENAFKHLSHHCEGRDAVEIRIGKDGDRMEFSVSNTTNASWPGAKDARRQGEENGSWQEKKDAQRQGGIGLANVKRRLELLYPGKHTLVINQSTDRFDVVLRLNIRQ